jgi:Family of unknown function (DUF6152)
MRMTHFPRIAAALLIGMAPLAPLAAHHGWAWATTEEFELSGTVKQVRHGNPHGVMLLATPSGEWTVEIGQPWRNEQAGLTPQILVPGTKLLVHGHRSAKKGQRLMKAERIVIRGKSYNLYPDRPS